LLTQHPCIHCCSDDVVVGGAEQRASIIGARVQYKRP
jgi:hypothetical protein